MKRAASEAKYHVARSVALLLRLLKVRSAAASWAFGASLAFGLLVHPWRLDPYGIGADTGI